MSKRLAALLGRLALAPQRSSLFCPTNRPLTMYFPKFNSEKPPVTSPKAELEKKRSKEEDPEEAGQR